MKNKTTLSILIFLLITALFVSCTTNPASGGGTSGTGTNGNNGTDGGSSEGQPLEVDQVIVTLKIGTNMAKHFTSPINGTLDFHFYDNINKMYLLKATKYIRSNDGEIVLDKSYYESVRSAQNAIKVYFSLPSGLFATNSSKPNFDTTSTGTKRITITVDTDTHAKGL